MSFPTSSLSLRRLDASTECPICKCTPFSGPVSIACGHSFCSRCIRDSLNAVTNAAERRCPVCGEPAKESDVRRNRSLEEISEAWLEARPELVSLISKQNNPLKRKATHAATAPPRPPFPQQTSSSSSSSLPQLVETSSAQAQSGKRQRLSSGTESPLRGRSRSASGSASGVGGSVSPGKRGSGSGEGRRMSGDVVVLDGSSDREGDVGENGMGAVSDESDVDGVEEDDDDEVEIVGEQANDPNRLVSCPICTAQLPLGHIDTHISRGCPPPPKTSRSTQAKGWNAIFSGTTTNAVAGSSAGVIGTREDPELWTKRIRKPNWNMAGDKELRGILGSYGLGTEGDKVVLGERLRLWISLFNANLDTNRPKNKSALRGELVRQEKAGHKDKEDAVKAKKAYKETGPGGTDDDEVFRKMIADVRARQKVKAG